MSEAVINGLPLWQYEQLKSQIKDRDKKINELRETFETKLGMRIYSAILKRTNDSKLDINERIDFKNNVIQYLDNATSSDIFIKMDEEDIIITFKNVVKD